jgi:hypothetical protein
MSEDAGAHHPKFSAEDFAAFTDARIAALKAGLKLTPEQEKNWPALEAALRERAKARAARIAEKTVAKLYRALQSSGRLPLSEAKSCKIIRPFCG